MKTLKLPCLVGKVNMGGILFTFLSQEPIEKIEEFR